MRIRARALSALLAALLSLGVAACAQDGTSPTGAGAEGASDPAEVLPGGTADADLEGGADVEGDADVDG